MSHGPHSNELYAWWMYQAEEEALRTIPKAVEYGSNSMLDLGRSLGRAMHRTDLGDEEAMELACFFYIQGKMGRWLDSIVAGKRPGDDTPFDIQIYAKMVQRIRAVGSWPGPNSEIPVRAGLVVGEQEEEEEEEPTATWPADLAEATSASVFETFRYVDGKEAKINANGECMDDRCTKLHTPSDTDPCNWRE